MSIPVFLESLILRNLASYDTWTFGTSGAGTLLVPNGQFLIVTDFDYFHFVDEQPNTGSSAISDSWVDLLDPTDIVNIDYDFGAGGIFINQTLDPGNVAATNTEFQNQLDLQVTGWTVSLAFNPALGFGRWFITMITPVPGTPYNGQTPTITANDPVVLVTDGVFGGGAITPTTAAQMVNNSIHQLEFRQKGHVHSWIVAEDLQLYFPSGGTFYGNVTGCYQKRGLYIPFTENVQIGIIRVPPASTWGISYTTLTTKSNEPKLPAGYGIAGAGINVVANVVFDNVNEQYIPVTKVRSTIALEDYRQQFKVDYTSARVLNNPQSAGTGFTNAGAGRRYPIVNIGFIRVNMDFKAFQKEADTWLKIR